MARQLTNIILDYIDKLVRGMDALARLLLLVLVLWVSVSVLMRYIFNSPISISLEIAMILNVILVYLPLAACMKGGNHPAITTLTDKVDSKAKAVLQLINLFFLIVIGCLLIYMFWQDMIELINYKVGLDSMPSLYIGYIRIPMIVGMGIFILLAIAYFCLTLRNLLKGYPFRARPEMKISSYKTEK